MSATLDRAPAVDDAIAQLRDDLAAIRPDLAERLDNILGARPEGDYVRLGEASRDLGVSRNTLKKWIKVGLVRNAMQMPAGSELRIPRGEIQRLREYAVARVAIAALGDDDEEVETRPSGTPPWRR